MSYQVKEVEFEKNIMEKDKNLSSSKNETGPVSLKNNVIVQELEKELLLYDLTSDKAFCLNETASIIWNLCDGQNTIEDIRRETSLQLKTQITEEMIWLALDKFRSEQLLSNYREIKVDFKGLSRRQAIKKAGLATIAALPLISTIIFPVAAEAQSQAVCSSSTSCFCQDASCLTLGGETVLDTPCISQNCTNTGVPFCQCVGPFICSNTPGFRLGRCGLV